MIKEKLLYINMSYSYNRNIVRQSCNLPLRIVPCQMMHLTLLLLLSPYQAYVFYLAGNLPRPYSPKDISQQKPCHVTESWNRKLAKWQQQAIHSRCHETPHRAHRAASRRARRVTGRFATSSVLPFTYSTFPAYSVKSQAPSCGCFNYISARCARCTRCARCGIS